MEIIKKTDGTALTIAPEGRIDTVTAPELEKELSFIDGVTDLTLDFANVEYISSAGLRVLLAAYKAMQGKGSMKITNINDIVREVFDVTGFSDILTIE